ncbi:MAG: hypothetical protein A2W33_06340 [Chloroflexi bacterium RBG_16_52_11]|nr:MAG: hypothetical protein A2W33_06340 [Chloroflexi bacterium RBG_16_52_11]
MTTSITRREVEALSAYLDGQLSEKERIRLERDLQLRADLRALLEDLQRTRGLLRSQPMLRAPRNFTLTPQMAGVKTFKPARRRLVPAISLVSVMAAALFMLVLVGDLVSFGRKPELLQLASQSVPLPMEVEAPAAYEARSLDSRVATEAPPPAEAVAENAFALTTPTPTLEATSQALSLAEAYPPPEAGMAKSADATRDIVTTPTLLTPYPEPLPTMVAQADELPAEELSAEELPAEELKEVETQAQRPPIQTRWNTWRLAEVALGLMALSFGALAYFLARSSRP